MRFITVLFTVFAFLLVTQLLFAEAQEQSQCEVGRVSLKNVQPFTTTTDVFGGEANITFHFCGTAGEESMCGEVGVGYIEVSTDMECVESFVTMVEPLAFSGVGGATYFTVANSDGSSHFRVNMACDETLVPGVVHYGGAVHVIPPNASNDDNSSTSSSSSSSTSSTSTSSSSVMMFAANFSSADGCPSRRYFCNSTADCVGARCVGGVCVDVSCVALAGLAAAEVPPAVFVGRLRAADCDGRPLRGLRRADISVRLDGADVDRPPLAPAVDSVRAPAGSGAVRLTTLLVQQSPADGEVLLKQALHELLEAIAAAENSRHYIALVVLDGSSQPTTVQPHTTDITVLETAIDSLPVDTPDPQSSNLNGAIIFALEGTYSMCSIFDGDCYASLVIFSDGYDTAGRVTDADTISKAEYFVSKNVSILAFGTANSSNSAFLRQVANSGYFEANSEVSTTEALQEMAERITSAQNNVYHILICIPNRKGNVTVSVSLNPPETFPNTVPFEYILNTDGFTGGCNESLLNETIASLENTSTSTLASKYLSPGGFINETVDAYEGFFFHTNCSDDECVVGASTNVTTDPDSFTVFILKEPRCFLSPFCFDATFNDTYIMNNNVSVNYEFMLLSRLNYTASFMVTSLSADDQWTVPPPFLSRNQTGIRDMSGEADRDAIIIFSVFTILLLLSVCFCVFFHRRQKPEGSDGFSKPHKEYLKPEYQYKKSSSSIELDVPALPHREQAGDQSVRHRFVR